MTVLKERWLLCLILQLIVCAVLFAFCRQFRKWAIIFSCLGLAIFLVSWLLFSIVFTHSLTVAHADFCSDGRPFLRSRLMGQLPTGPGAGAGRAAAGDPVGQDVQQQQEWQWRRRRWK